MEELGTKRKNEREKGDRHKKSMNKRGKGDRGQQTGGSEGRRQASPCPCEKKRGMFLLRPNLITIL